MKSLAVAVAAVISCATISIASANNASNNEESQYAINFEKLNYALRLTPTQVNQVYDINSDYALNISASKTDRQVIKSVYSNLAQMKSVLSEKQYLQYVAMMNLTKSNRTALSEEKNYFVVK